MIMHILIAERCAPYPANFSCPCAVLISPMCARRRLIDCQQGTMVQEAFRWREVMHDGAAEAAGRKLLIEVTASSQMNTLHR